MTNSPMTTEDLWNLLSAKLRSFILRRVSNEQVADDLLQETFIRIHRNLDSMGDQQRITAWVFQIARNLIVDYYRSKGRDAMAYADELETHADIVNNLNEQVIGWLAGMIAQLPNHYREAVELYELQGVPQQEIADRLDISLSGAKSRVQRGRAKLRSLLFECCSFEMDHQGNIIGYEQNADGPCEGCCKGEASAEPGDGAELENPSDPKISESG